MSLDWLPLGKFLETSAEAERIFGANKVAEYLEKCRSQLKTGKGLSDSTLQSFDTYLSTQPQSLKDFGVIKLASGETLSERLAKQNNPELEKKLNAALKAAANTPPEAIEEQKKFKKLTKQLHGIIKKDPPDYIYSAETLADHLQKDIKNPACAAIDKLEQLEKDRLNQCFDSEDNAALRAAIGDDNWPQFKEEAIKNSQAKRREAFEKSINDSIAQLHDDAQMERDRIAYLMCMYNHDEAMRKDMDKMGGPDATRVGAGADVEFDMKKGVAMFKDLTLDQLHTIRTITGREIKCTKNDKGQISFSMQLPRFGIFYYNWRHNKLHYDFTSLAMALKAAGASKQGATITIKQNDPIRARMEARAAVEAYIKAGIPADKIFVRLPKTKEDREKEEKSSKDDKDKDKDMRTVPHSELFTEHPGVLDAAKKSAKEQQEKLERLLKAKRPTAEEETKRFRAELDQTRLEDVDQDVPRPLNTGIIKAH